MSCPITLWQIDEETMESDRLYFPPESLWSVMAAMKLKEVCSLEENIDKTRQNIKK